jgi:hypothetical protein
VILALGLLFIRHILGEIKVAKNAIAMVNSLREYCLVQFVGKDDYRQDLGKVDHRLERIEDKVDDVLTTLRNGTARK